MTRVSAFGLLVGLALLAAACGTSGGASNDDTRDGEPTPTRAAAAFLTPAAEVEPIRFPEDEAPHENLTEWWYYTGHLFAPDGTRYGFEYVFFQGQRGEFPPYFASHFAITDSADQEFVFDERFGVGAVRDTPAGFSLELGGWTMAGALGEDRLAASMPGYAIDLRLSATKPPALHNGTGYVDFGPAGGSYYYSRTRMAVEGTLNVDGESLPVTGEAWFDHQWGNFISVGEGGWDWFSVQLEDGRDLTISLIRDGQGALVMSYGTLVDAAGGQTHLTASEIEVAVTDVWTSAESGATWPAGWTVDLPNAGWSLTLTPSMAGQELRTTLSTGVTYWEGEVLIEGAIDGAPVAGLGYVELTGYASGLEARPGPQEGRP